MMFTDKSRELIFELSNEAFTEALAGRLARMAEPGDVFTLIGDLGAGKTVFARAFIRARCDERGEVPSPTFTLLQTYDSGDVTIYHFDLYRINHAEEALELGIEEAFADGITLIEWGERLGPLLPANRLDVNLLPGKTNEARCARLAGQGYWRARLGEGFSEGAIHA